MLTVQSGEEIRRVILEIISEMSSEQGCVLQSGTILQRVVKQLNLKGDRNEQAVLTLFYDLFRVGYLSWGHNIPNSNPPCCHVTDIGRHALANMSRDPANPDGYITYLSGMASINPIADSYIREALQTFNSNCYKAAAVLIGVATESLVLELRDIVLNKIQEVGEPIPRRLSDWRIKTVIDSLEQWFRSKREVMENSLFEAFIANWPAFTYQIRKTRNDAGHANSIQPVTQEEVHASLLIFPNLCSLMTRLKGWVAERYSSERS